MEKYVIAAQNNVTYLEYELKDGDLMDEIDCGMLTSNQIYGLLPLNVRWLDSKCTLMYKITGLTPLNCAQRILSSEMALTNFIKSLARTERTCDEYLLNLCKLDLAPENVYVGTTGEAVLIYLPLQGESKAYQINSLLKYVIGLVGQSLPEDSRLLSKLLMKLMYSESISLAELEQSLSEKSKKSAEDVEADKTPQHDHIQPVYEAEKPSQRIIAPCFEPEEQQQAPTPQSLEKVKLQKRSWFGPSKDTENQKENQNVRGDDNPFASMRPPVKSVKVEENDIPAKKKAKRAGLFSGFGKKSKKKEVQEVNPFSETETSTTAAPAQPVFQYSAPAQKPKNNASRTIVLDNTHADSSSMTRLMNTDKETPKLFFVQKSTGQYIHITHDNFHIGRAQGVVDFTVPNASEYLGNDHAYISIVDGCYYIVDNNTLNHTYLNESMLPPSKPTQIHAGDTIRMADVVFTVVEGS